MTGKSKATRQGQLRDEFRDEAVKRIRDQVGDGKVICGLSGGVDPAVAARLVREALAE